MRWDAAEHDRGRMDTTRSHTLVISGLLGALGPLVGNGLYSGADSDSGEAIIEEFRNGLPTIGLVALPLELIGFCAQAVFFGCLVVRLFRVTPVAAVTAAIAGATSLAVKVGSAAPLMVVIWDADHMSPEMAHTMIALNNMAFVVSSGLLFGLALAAVGVGLLQTDTPRFLAWWPAVMGPLAVVTGIVGVASPDAYLPLPFLLLLIWMIVIAIATAMRPTTPVNGANSALSSVAAPE